MKFETISYNLTDGVAVVTLNRPKQLNAMNTQMRAELQYILPQAPKDGARALVLTGAGRAFCSGQDFGNQTDASNIDLERLLRDEYRPIMDAISNCPVPTIAAVNGAAAGAGCNLALSADVVVAAHSAYFLQAFTRIGLMPDAGGTHILPRNVGLAKAMGAALFAEKITAQDADEMGMIWEAVPDAEFENTWTSRAVTLAQGPTIAYQKIKTAVRASFETDRNTQLDHEATFQGECGTTHDFQEGVSAFVDKRLPKFEGR